METFISHISVKGLHGRISFDTSLKPDINIIYGKNGLGKTTLLHIIANLAEGDLQRFSFLNFSEINITNSKEKKLTLKKHDGKINYSINEEDIFEQPVGVGAPRVSYKEITLGPIGDKIRDVLGSRCCYLPAFRSVLERSRESYAANAEDMRHPDYDELLETEEYLSRLTKKDREYFYVRETNSRNTAYKTVRCRTWFGAMVPVIRYPSITDVADGLGEEWGAANYKTSRLEQDQYEKAFLDIFEAVLLDRKTTSGLGDQKDMLSSINNLLNDEALKTRSGHGGATYARLFDIASKAGLEGTKYNPVLEIYLKLLETRKVTREEEYKPIVEFEAAVNTFLDGKELQIGAESEMSARRVRGSRARIYPKQGKPYPLGALSSGERQIATMLFAASRSSLTPGALLIDEPELSLHVDWQRHILKELIKQNPKRQIIACTHSPEVGADHKSNILFFKPTENTNDIEDMNGDEPLGDDNE